MPSCEVQRTLVKSPPELWAELSDPASLARHLGEFGEIRIARIEPETAVEWEAENVRGVVELKASGWGTKVTLTAVREQADEEAPATEPAPGEAALSEELEPSASPADTELTASFAAAPPEPEAETEPATPLATELAIVAQPEFELESEPTAIVEAEPKPERRRGLFARLFRRRRRAQSTPEPEILDTYELPPAAAAESALDELDHLDEPLPADPGPFDESLPTDEPHRADEPKPFPVEESVSTDKPDLATELAQVEQTMVEQDTALLTAVLDRLGAAHHRPFSRG
jgi:hypothetical protein